MSLSHRIGLLQDIRLQSLPPENGLGRFHLEAAAGHGRMTLLLNPTKNGEITLGNTRKYRHGHCR